MKYSEPSQSPGKKRQKSLLSLGSDLVRFLFLTSSENPLFPSNAA